MRVLFGTVVCSMLGCGGGRGALEAPRDPDQLAQARAAAGAQTRSAPGERADLADIARLAASGSRAVERHDFAAAEKPLAEAQRQLEARHAAQPADVDVAAILALVHQSQAQRLRGLEADGFTRADYCAPAGSDDPRVVAIAHHNARARALLKVNCDAGDAQSCANLGVIILTDVCGDRSGIVDAYARGCAGGVTTACTELGNFHGQGQFVAVDARRAKAYYQQSCDAGDQTGCAHLGIAYDRGAGVEQDGARAVALYSGACDAGSMVGCNSLGLLYQRGRHVDEDMGKARALFERACAGKHPHACTRLAEFHLEGVAGLSVDQARAVELFDRGCQARSAQGCFALGVAYERAVGVKRDMGMATRLYSMACELGHKSGCFNMGNGHARGDSLPQSFSRALVFWKRACALSHERACLMLEFHDEDGPIRR